MKLECIYSFHNNLSSTYYGLLCAGDTTENKIKRNPVFGGVYILLGSKKTGSIYSKYAKASLAHWLVPHCVAHRWD